MSTELFVMVLMSSENLLIALAIFASVTSKIASPPIKQLKRDLIPSRYYPKRSFRIYYSSSLLRGRFSTSLRKEAIQAPNYSQFRGLSCPEKQKAGSHRTNSPDSVSPIWLGENCGSFLFQTTLKLLLANSTKRRKNSISRTSPQSRLSQRKAERGMMLRGERTRQEQTWNCRSIGIILNFGISGPYLSAIS